ncbi:MAG: hypothetical protein IPK82_28655 [Polyangiaceae bacterium]|nr:hypothetical protein [Polyangiaceae bacterium]
MDVANPVDEKSALSLLECRAQEVANHLGTVSEMSFEAARNALVGRVLVTGIGGSAGPARLLAWLSSQRQGVHARYVPMSGFTSDNAPVGDTLVVFSQYLSPNATLVLKAASHFRRVVLVTSVPPNSNPLQSLLTHEQTVIVHLPPADEKGLFLRVIGPTVATLFAIQVTCGPLGRSEFGELYKALCSAGERALAAAAEVSSDSLRGALAFVFSGADPSVFQGLVWKWMEGLRCAQPWAWDALELAHGPVQSVRGGMPWVVFTQPDSPTGDLTERVHRVLVSNHQVPVFLRSELPFPISILDHDAQLNALLLRVLKDCPLDLRSSALAVFDEPLYGLGRS